MKPNRKRQIALQVVMLLIGYPIAVVALMRLVTPHVQSPWIAGSIFLAFTLLFLRLVTGVRTTRIFGRRW